MKAILLILILSSSISFGKECVWVSQNQKVRGKICLSLTEFSAESKGKRVVYPSKTQLSQNTLKVTGDLRNILQLLDQKNSSPSTSQFLVVGFELYKDYFGNLKIERDEGFMILNGTYFTYSKNRME